MNIAMAVYAFGQQLGLTDLALDEHGLVSLALDDDDRLHLEQAQDDLLIYRLLNKPHMSAPSMLAALKACDQRHNNRAWMPRIGLIGDGGQAQLVVLCRLPSGQVSAQSIEQTVDELEHFKRQFIDRMGQ
jgi:type III secretion system chaperone SycN